MSGGRLLALLASALGTLAGCTDTPAVSPIVTVEKFDATQGCFAACGPGLGPAPELGLPRTCPMPADACGFRGGADQLRVVVDYGGVQFPTATNVAPPVITLLLDDHVRHLPRLAGLGAPRHVLLQPGAGSHSGLAPGFGRCSRLDHGTRRGRVKRLRLRTPTP